MFVYVCGSLNVHKLASNATVSILHSIPPFRCDLFAIFVFRTQFEPPSLPLSVFCYSQHPTGNGALVQISKKRWFRRGSISFVYSSLARLFACRKFENESKGLPNVSFVPCVYAGSQIYYSNRIRQSRIYRYLYSDMSNFYRIIKQW